MQYADYTLKICEQHDFNFALKQLEANRKVVSESVHSHCFEFNVNNKLKPLYTVKKIQGKLKKLLKYVR